MRSSWECKRRGGVGPWKQAGFTLIEILLVVVVAVTLIGVAIPVFSRVMQTYRLNGAARQVVSEMRRVQSLAVTRGGVFGFHWGGDPVPTGRSDSEYRIERDATGACGFPPPTDTTGNPDVITEWTDLARDFTGVTISSFQDNSATDLGGVMFDSQGAALNTCTAVAFPLTVTVADTEGETRTIEIRSAGSVRIQ